MEKPMIDADFLLKKIEGKGGWTFTEVPDVLPHRKNVFGYMRVRGTIDSYEIRGYHLMPMKEGTLFLPVKLEIRKKIGKQAGDTVRVILYADDLPTEVPEELIECLQTEPGIYEKFAGLPDSDKKGFIDWIYSAKTDETKASRIVKTMEKIAKGLKVYQ